MRRRGAAATRAILWWKITNYDDSAPPTWHLSHSYHTSPEKGKKKTPKKNNTEDPHKATILIHQSVRKSIIPRGNLANGLKIA